MGNSKIETFKKELYSPYLRAWEIISGLKDKDLSKQTTWDEWMKQCEEFRDSFPNEYCHSLYRVILDAGDEAKRIFNEV